MGNWVLLYDDEAIKHITAGGNHAAAQPTMSPQQ